ncbi:MAG: hypothetical protein JWP74_842 [Marmoricola sp.]|nr:hypothetical protein [Marmoricola sp.]
MTRNSRPRAVLTVLAGVLAVLCLAVLGVRIVDPGHLPPARSAASAVESRNDAVTSAARMAAIAFLDIDYRGMDARVDRMLALSTGAFRQQYAAKRAVLVAATVEGQAVSSGTIRSIGIENVTGTRATVSVAADSVVNNLAIEQAKKNGQAADDKRYYRFKIDLDRVSGRWLVSDLQFVS